MAKETKTDYFRVSSENTVIETWESFGWEVLTTQKCDYNGYDAVKITFSRDKEMKNYEEIAKLNYLYDRDAELLLSLDDEKQALKRSIADPPKFNFIIGFICCSCFCIPLIFYIVKLRKAKKDYEKKLVANKQRRKEIDNQKLQLAKNCENYIQKSIQLLK